MSANLEAQTRRLESLQAQGEKLRLKLKQINAAQSKINQQRLAIRNALIAQAIENYIKKFPDSAPKFAAIFDDAVNDENRLFIADLLPAPASPEQPTTDYQQNYDYQNNYQS
jgi:hypothetical protein